MNYGISILNNFRKLQLKRQINENLIKLTIANNSNGLGCSSSKFSGEDR